MLQPTPGMEPTRRQSQKPQQCPQRHTLTGMIHGTQDPHLGASVGQTLVRQRESRASKQSESEPKECRELPHASPELQDFLHGEPAATLRPEKVPHSATRILERVSFDVELTHDRFRRHKGGRNAGHLPTKRRNAASRSLADSFWARWHDRTRAASSTDGRSGVTRGHSDSCRPVEAVYAEKPWRSGL
jgi:hypothetical protein